MTNRQRVAAIAGSIFIATLASACGNSTTAGDATPQPSRQAPTSAAAPTSDPTSTSERSASGTLEQADPCGLITPSERKGLGLTTTGEPENSVTSRGCSWQDGSHDVISVSIREHQSIDTLKKFKDTGPVTSLKIHGRDARQRARSSSCVVAVSVTDSSRVDVRVVMSSGNQACAAARQVTKVVERHLPRSK